MKPKVALVHDTYEGNDTHPVVRHVFYGQSTEEVYKLLDIHKANDKFIRECTDKGRFELQFQCRTTVRVERVR